jgi:hypothetical protein
MPSRPRAVARVALLLIGCLIGGVGDAAAAEWTYAASQHFEVYTTGGSRRAREALSYFEKVHAFFAEVLDLSPQTDRRTRLIVVSNDQEFKPYRLNEVSVAYYHRGPERDHIVMRALDSEAYAMVVHEYAHLVMNHSGRDYPAWFSEGYAEFLSTMTFDGSRVNIGRVPEGRLQYLRSADAVFDLPRLFAVTLESPEYRTLHPAGMFYAQSWALVHMLAVDDRYRASFERFAVLVGTGQSSEAALSHAFGRSIAAVSNDLAPYMHRERYGFTTVGYVPPPPVTSYDERPATDFEAGLVAANLIGTVRGNEERARTAFQELEAQSPADLALVESRALFEVRYGQRDAARPYLRRAASLGSRNPRIYREIASFPDIDPAEAESLLQTALSLQSDDFWSRRRLASLLLDRHDATGALAILEPVTTIPPEEHFEVAQLRAHAHLALKDAAAARAAALVAQTAATNQQQRSSAARLLRNIDDFVANQAVIAAILANRAATEAARAAAAAAKSNTSRAADPADSRVSMDGHALQFVTGRLRLVMCGTPPAIEVDTPQTTLTFVIDAPKMIRVFGAGTTEVDLPCGWQDRPVRVGYYVPVRSGRASGNVRVLDYR